MPQQETSIVSPNVNDALDLVQLPSPLKSSDSVELISNTQQINQDSLRRSPLHVAVRDGSLTTTLALLNQDTGLSSSSKLINLKDKNGNTALHFAASNSSGKNNVAILKALLHHGASVDAMNEHGQNPLAVHIITSNPLGTSSDGSETLQILLAKGGNPNVRLTHNGNTLLWEAIERNMIKTAQYLVLAGADMNICNGNGKTTSEMLVEHRSLQKLLVKCIRQQPRAIPTKKIQECMDCLKKLSWRNKACNCEYCGRVVCRSCALNSLTIQQCPKFFFQPSYDTLSHNSRAKAPKQLREVCNLCFQQAKCRPGDDRFQGKNPLYKLLRPGLRVVAP